MNPIISFIKRHPLFSFFVIAYLFAWLGWISGIADLVVPEEEGWLPRLSTLGPKPAAVLSGFLHGTWHLPLILLTPFCLAERDCFLTIPLFLLLLTAAGTIYGGLRLAADSLWSAIILHGAFKAFPGVFSKLTVFASPSQCMWWERVAC